MTSWSERLYQSLTQHLRPPRQHPGSRGRQIRRLFGRILRPAESSAPRDCADESRSPAGGAGDHRSFGFESPPSAASRLSPICQAVLVAWAGPAGHLSPAGLRAAVVANFVVQVNRAFGHSADAVASVPTKAAVAGVAASAFEDQRRRRLLSDLSLIGMRAFRLESEDCYARESHRLSKLLRSFSLLGTEGWCDRRLRDLLAALARVERASCHRLHCVAGRDEARRLAELSSGLQALGYPGLAVPAPWRLHVEVGPVTLAAEPGYRRRGRPSPEELVALAGCRDSLLLQLLASPRARPVELSPWPSCRNAKLADTLQRCRLNLSSSSSSIERADRRANLNLVLDDADIWESDVNYGDSNDFCSRLELTIAHHLAEFPEAAATAYLSYEPRHLVAHLAWLVRLLEAAICLLDDSGSSGMSGVGLVDARARQRLSVCAAASGQVVESACGVLGLR